MISRLKKTALRKASQASQWLPTAAGALVPGLCFAIYLSSLAPTVLHYEFPELQDAAVLQAKAALLGVPDYTGYPLWVMLGKLFTFLPVGDLGYRVNLSSAVYAALTVLFVYLMGMRLTGWTVAAAGGALAFGVSQIFWSQAVIAEVYTLNTLLIATVIYVLLLWRYERKDSQLLLACFLMGLALTNHLTSGLLIPAAFLLVGVVDRSKLTEGWLILKGAGIFALGLLPYIYIPIRASMDYLPNYFVWGQPALQQNPPNTLEGFWTLVSGGAWKDRMFSQSPSELLSGLETYVDHLWGSTGQFNLLLIVAAIAGFYHLAYRDRAVTVVLSLLFTGWLFYALGYDIADIKFYFIPTYLVLCIWIAVAFGGLLDSIRLLANRWRAPAVGSLATAFVALILLLPLVGVQETYAQVDRSGDFRGKEVVETVAEKAGQGATILHYHSPLTTMILAEDRREDIRLINHEESLGPPGVVKAQRALDRGPVYILFPTREGYSFYKGVEQSRKIYADHGLELREVDQDVLLYQVVAPDKSSSPGRES